MIKELIKKSSCCNNYSLLTPLSGVGGIAEINSNTFGDPYPFVTGAANGTIIRSVTFKAMLPDTAPSAFFNPPGRGMIRLYIGNPDGTVKTLYEEIPILERVSLATLPPPVELTYGLTLPLGLKLEAGYTLCVSGIYAYPVFVFAEGLDISYPETPPAVCCDFMQETAMTATGTISDDTITPIWVVADSTGVYLRSITVKALQSTHEGLVSIYIDNLLFKEVYIPQTNQSAYEPSYRYVMELDYFLPQTFIISASTQNAESFALTIQGMGWSYPA